MDINEKQKNLSPITAMTSDQRSWIISPHFCTTSCFKSYPELVTQGLQQCSALGQWSPLTSTQVSASRESERGQTNTMTTYEDDTMSMWYRKKIYSGKHEEIKHWHELSEELPHPPRNCSHPAGAGKWMAKWWWGMMVCITSWSRDYVSCERYQSLIWGEQAILWSDAVKEVCNSCSSKETKKLIHITVGARSAWLQSYPSQESRNSKH